MAKGEFCPAGVLVNSHREFRRGRTKKRQLYLSDIGGRRVILEAQLSNGTITDGEGECGFEKIGAELDSGAKFSANRCGLCEAFCFGRAIGKTSSQRLPMP